MRTFGNEMGKIMKTMGLVISHKNNEARRALLPKDLKKINHVSALYFEAGYGEKIGCTDDEYAAAGANIVTREEALQCDIIVDVKLGDADYVDAISEEKILVGWAHAAQQIAFTDAVIANNHTVLAWEEMYEGGRYIFYRNREIAGEAGILQAYQYVGKMPYETKVAVLGNGQTAKGALRILHGLGANVDVYGYRLEELFKKNMYDYDVIVNCVLWDTNRTDRIIYKEDLQQFKRGAMIVDISCNKHLEIETTKPTTIDDPVYTIDGVIHYAVDNTPAIFPHSVTSVLSEGFAKYVDKIMEDAYDDVLNEAILIKEGHILDEDVLKFREARNLVVK